MKKFIIAGLALMFCISWAAPETFGQSRKELTKLAKKGDAEAQYKLGYCYYFGYDGYGTGMEKAKEDLKQAEKWLLEAVPATAQGMAQGVRARLPAVIPRMNALSATARDASSGKLRRAPTEQETIR